MLLKIKGKKKVPRETAISTENMDLKTPLVYHQLKGGVKSERN